MSALEDAVKHIEFSADNESDRKWAKDARTELEQMTAVIEAVKTKVVPFLKNVQDDVYCDNDGRGCGCNSEAEKLEAEIVSILAEYDGAK